MSRQTFFPCAIDFSGCHFEQGNCHAGTLAPTLIADLSSQTSIMFVERDGFRLPMAFCRYDSASGHNRDFSVEHWHAYCVIAK